MAARRILMLDLLITGCFFRLRESKKTAFFLHFGVDYLGSDMVLFNNGMVAKILFLQPSHYIKHNNRISRKKQEYRQKKIDFF